MSRRPFGAARAPIALVTLLSFTSSLAPVRLAFASEPAPPVAEDSAPSSEAKVAEADAPEAEAPAREGKPEAPREHLTTSRAATPFLSRAAVAMAAGEGSSEVSSGATSLPQGAGQAQGMGESFGAQLSTGIATYSVPFALLTARGAAQPTLTLTYASSSGTGVAGMGFAVGVPYVARKTDHGHPTYQDPARGVAPTAAQDDFVYNGAELIPICLVSGGACSGALSAEVMPRWAEGWQYFRLRFETSYQRFFWSPDHRTWRIQDKSGVSAELGAPLDGTNDGNAIEAAPDDPTHIFRWNAARQYDLHGDGDPAGDAQPKPYNTVVYRYLTDGGISYVSDIYDTPPATGAVGAPLARYAHHTHLRWEARPDPLATYRRGWAAEQGLRLAGVDVTSKPFAGADAPRAAVRRYHLAYDAASHVSMLASVQLEGRCGDEASAPVEQADGTLGATSCPRLPPVAFEYTHVRRADGSIPAQDLPGYEGYDDTVHALAGSLPAIDDGTTSFYDLNGDGLLDVLSTNAAAHGGAHAAFLNGGTGAKDTFGAATPMAVPASAPLDAYSLSFKNANVVPLDFDGDGTVDLVHMLPFKAPTVYTPSVVNGVAAWSVRTPNVPASLDPKIDLAGHNPQVRVADIDGDGLVDIVATGSDRVQTYFALGRYAGGDGKFGSATYDAAGNAILSADPVTACLPYGGSFARLGDPDVRLADVNGDGLVDFVRARPGDIRYWPGRGDGHFGTGALAACKAGALVDSAFVAMTGSPVLPGGGLGLSFGDVNGDGLADLVQIRSTGANVWLNVDGVGWTARRSVAPAVAATSATRVRLSDVNGSGTPDLVWGDPGNYRYVDLLGGARPALLTRVTSGLGATTDIEYTTSTEEMLAAAGASQRWGTTAPMVLHIVKRVTVRDHLEAVGRAAGVYVTAYGYRDPIYDGVQREFRGFREATETHPGDASGPTQTVTTSFLLGECVGACGPESRFEDNPREALKGLPSVVETADASGVALATHHTTYRLRHLYAGLDGRAVSAVFASRSDTFRYDTASFDRVAGSASIADVEVEATPGAVVSDAARSIPLRSTAGRVRVAEASAVDPFGSATDTIAYGCIEGCAAVDEVITSHATPTRLTTDGSGWTWRTTERWVVGSRRPAELRDHDMTDYDAHGQAVASRAELRGSLPLVRAAAKGAPFAPQPAGASKDGIVSLGTSEYDPFGNVVRSRGPSGCHSADFDPAYADLVVVSTTFAGPRGSDGCGARLLVTTAEYDRGAETPRATTGYNGERARVDLDGFGRVVRSFTPDPARLGETTRAAAAEYEYVFPANPAAAPYSVVHTRAQSGATTDDATYVESYQYTDALGRPLLALRTADKSAGDGGDWVVSGRVDYAAKGGAVRRYGSAFWSGDPLAYPLGTAPATPFARQVYDAFGRPLDAFAEDGTQRLHTAYHALSEDTWDAADLAQGSHAGGYRTVTGDGHGRTISQIERFHEGGKLGAREQRNEYLPTGEPTVITRLHVGTSDPPVVRWLRYDSLGRRVLNADPDTTKGFVADPETSADLVHAWRYAYDDGDRLVGTSDARGCGENYFYDAAGRVIAEDFSPCTEEQPPYTAPDLDTGSGTEAFYRYDTPDPDADAAAAAGCATSTATRGRVVSLASRGTKSMTGFDGRGRAVCTARRIARPGPPAASLAARYAPRWYVQETTFDAADRGVAETTGARSTELLGAAGSSQVTLTYAKGGALASVGSSYGPLVTSYVRDADGAPLSIAYGDAAKTTTSFTYDARHRVHDVQTVRARAPLWSAPVSGYVPPPNGAPPTLQLVLEDGEIVYDDSDNPVELRDHRIPDEWPAGAKPVSRTMTYDDFNRVTSVHYDHAGGADSWTSPFDAEDHDTGSSPEHARPAPHGTFDQRLATESFRYDWLGNSVASSDDTSAFYDRSLGTITNGTAAAGPYQLRGASNRDVAGPRGGDLATTYDDAGNLTAMVVRRDGPCAPAGSSCWPRFAYAWDEAGRLIAARRWDLQTQERLSGADLAAPPPSRAPDVALEYTYTASGERVLKAALDPQGHALYTAYVFGSLELRRAAWVTEAEDYQLDADTETPYLTVGGERLGRVVRADVDAPTATSGRQHVFLELPDHLGSTSIVLDKDTSELVERATYTAFGSAESDYRPERWKSFRDDYRFTGKEDDVEVGLQYFGKRYYAPQLARWVSADPLAIHKLAADPNVYAYVHGRTFATVDPDGQCELVCLMIIGALVSAAINMGTQYAQTGSLAEIDMGAVGLAAFGGAVGGGVGVAAAPLGAMIGPALGMSTEVATVAVSSAAGGAAAGAAVRGAGTILQQGGDAYDALGNAFNPADVATDFAIGAGTGLVVYGAGEGLKAGYGAIRRAIASGAEEAGGAGAGSASSTAARPGGGGPAGEPLVPDEPATMTPPPETEAVQAEEPQKPGAAAPSEQPEPAKPKPPPKAERPARPAKPKSDVPKIGKPDLIRYIDHQVTGMPAEYDFPGSKLEHEFKHAGDFGLDPKAKFTPEMAHKWAETLFQHTQTEGIEVREGTFRWKQQVVHYYNPTTNQWVAFDLQTRQLVGAWTLSGAQLTNFLGTNNVW